MISNLVNCSLIEETSIYWDKWIDVNASDKNNIMCLREDIDEDGKSELWLIGRCGLSKKIIIIGVPTK